MSPSDAVMALARHLVDQAEQLSNRVARMSDGPEKRHAILCAHGAIREAQGCVEAMRAIYDPLPENAPIYFLWKRINHCPVVMLVGPDEPADLQLAQ